MAERADLGNELRTRAADIVQLVTISREEHEPHIDDAPPEALVARVFAAVSQTAFTMSLYLGEVEPEDDHETPGRVLVVRFAEIAATALTAAARIHPDLCESPPLEAKSLLIRGLDMEVAEWQEEHGEWGKQEATYWFHATTTLLFGAGNGLCHLHGLRWEPEGPEEEQQHRYWELEDGETAEEAIADSLFAAAQAAARAAEWFEQEEDLADEHRF